ncbi:alkaline phosphatase [Thiocapsa imhoffii]|uniref:Alkaline phosphatase n=2 Tax=Thiocapsa imhoffii TaxID=382777 RepID=A0A9X0WJJ3_9GAMM|nr:alkaline phosphatase [Thiocapsa imhoffii]
MRLSRYAIGISIALGLANATAATPSFEWPLAISLSPIGTYESGLFGQSAAEIVAHDRRSQRLFVVNAQSGQIDVLDIRQPSNPRLLSSIDLGGVVNSVDVHRGLLVAAVEAHPKTDPGQAVFFDADGRILASVQVGALPDMITFTPDGRRVLVANEGEPSDDYSIDPEGSVSIIDLPLDLRRLTQDHVRTADFRQFNDAPLDPSIRIFGPNATVAQDLEPEYITVSQDSRTAWVALQENNAIAVLDIASGAFTDLRGLGFKDHLLPGNELDVSDRDGAIRIENWPVYGIYQPDAIASYRYRGQTYIVTANEGDTRDYPGFSEEVRFRALSGGTPPVCADAPRIQSFLQDNSMGIETLADLRDNANLGRLTVTKVDGLREDGSCYDAIFTFGARSFSIWNQNLEQVYDSGADFERITAELLPEYFNANHTSNDSFDTRSDNKGPEPEGIALARLWGRTYAFIGLERIGGIMVYDITNPHAPNVVQYLNNRDFLGDTESGTAGDLGPEGLIVIEGWNSPLPGVPLLVVANEVSGTTTLFRIDLVRR